MLIACSHCKAQYSLTSSEIQSLPFSILQCKKCNKNIKIAQCPECKSYYSITYTNAQKNQYTIKCIKCLNTFIAEFPISKTGVGEQKPVPTRTEPRYTDTKLRTNSNTAKDDARDLFPNLNKALRNENKVLQKESTFERHPASRVEKKADTADSSYTLREFLMLGLSAFSMPKIGVAAIGVFIIVLMIILYNVIVGLAYGGTNIYVSSLINLFPLAIIFFIYTIFASVICKMEFNKSENFRSPASFADSGFLTRSITASSVMNIALLLIADLILILFGELPIIGPIFFSLLFLPIYLVSLLIVMLFSIGFWFYPSIIAENDNGVKSIITDFFLFIKRNNFSLIYTILLMAIGTSLIFAAIYLLHYGALSLVFYLSRSILSEEGMKVFSAVPAPLLRISDMSIINANVSLFQTLIRGLFASHQVGGIILGIVFSAITILLMACMVSITATLSAKVYIQIRQGIDLDDSKKVRMLLIFVLMLAILFLFKKVFL